MNTSKIVVGLKYKPGFPAPYILFRSQGKAAERVLLLAQKFGIQQKKSDHLAQQLYRLPEGSWIPDEHFALVADLLAQVYFLQERNK